MHVIKHAWVLSPIQLSVKSFFAFFCLPRLPVNLRQTMRMPSQLESEDQSGSQAALQRFSPRSYLQIA